MGRPSLTGVDLKLNRGVNRFHAFLKAANEFGVDPDSKRLGIENHPQPPGLVVRVKEVRSPPPQLALLIGECVQSYRSALDHLAYQLLIANTKGRIPVKFSKRSEFPIFNSGPKFRGKFNRKGEPLAGSGWARIQGIDSAAAAEIERLQPYHRRKRPRSRILWQLQELSNIDKHRLLHVTQGAQRGSALTVIKAGNVAELRGPGFIPGPFKRGAVVGALKAIPIDPRRGIQLDVNPEILTDISFGQGSPARSVRGRSAIVTLYEIGAYIASDVLPVLTPFLGLSSSFDPGRLIDAHDLSPSEREVFGGSAEELKLNTPVRPSG